MGTPNLMLRRHNLRLINIASSQHMLQQISLPISQSLLSTIVPSPIPPLTHSVAPESIKNGSPRHFHGQPLASSPSPPSLPFSSSSSSFRVTPWSSLPLPIQAPMVSPTLLKLMNTSTSALSTSNPVQYLSNSQRRSYLSKSAQGKIFFGGSSKIKTNTDISFITTSSNRLNSSNPSNPSPEIKLYQYQICPFCNIAKALLSYANLEYEKVEVNPLNKNELKPWSGDYCKVPIALIDGEQLNGSDKIVASILAMPSVQEALEQRWKDDFDATKSTLLSDEIMTMDKFQSSTSSQQWSKFAADDLASLLYPNICGSLSDSYKAFCYVENVKEFSNMQKLSIRSFGALAMYFAAGKVKSKRNISDEKEALKLALDKFETERLTNNDSNEQSSFAPFFPHSSPHLGDIATFGVLHSVKGLNAHAEYIEMRGGRVKEWYGLMDGMVHGGK